MLNEIYQNLNPVAFSIGSFQVRWYGIAYIVGFVIAGIIFYFTAKRWKIKITEDKALAAILCGVTGIIIGARLGYVLFYGDGYYFSHPEKILAFHEGGMSFHGGLVGGLIGGIFAAKITKIPYLRLCDLAFIGVPVGLFFGRIANFINGELWGAPTDLPWGVVFHGAAGMMPRHPSQLYEALLEGLVLFIVLFVMSRKNPPFKPGTYFATFLILYSVFRFAVEFVRQPDSQLGYLAWDWLTMGQLLTIPLFIAGVFILIYANKKSSQ
ncbi:MAG: prolipoprotein diacylglyceryl transferase [Coriobacteriia bacterium]|nr:prolipoprotein diacylglyceryl transferase [Coriobacteriia bacterium]